MIRKMGWVKIYRNIPVIKDEGKYVTLHSKNAEVLAKAFVKIHISVHGNSKKVF